VISNVIRQPRITRHERKGSSMKHRDSTLENKGKQQPEKTDYAGRRKLQENHQRDTDFKKMTTWCILDAILK
jgi:hypothetical protein